MSLSVSGLECWAMTVMVQGFRVWGVMVMLMMSDCAFGLMRYYCFEFPQRQVRVPTEPSS